MAATDVQSVVLDPRNIVLKRVSYRTVGVADIPAVPETGFLDLWPQPWSPGRDGALSLRIGSARETQTAVYLHDLLGRRVATLHDGTTPAGDVTLRFDGRSLPRGVYTLLLVSDAGTSSRQLLVQ